MHVHGTARLFQALCTFSAPETLFVISPSALRFRGSWNDFTAFQAFYLRGWVPRKLSAGPQIIFIPAKECFGAANASSQLGSWGFDCRGGIWLQSPCQHQASSLETILGAQHSSSWFVQQWHPQGQNTTVNARLMNKSFTKLAVWELRPLPCTAAPALPEAGVASLQLEVQSHGDTSWDTRLGLIWWTSMGPCIPSTLTLYTCSRWGQVWDFLKSAGFPVYCLLPLFDIVFFANFELLALRNSSRDKPRVKNRFTPRLFDQRTVLLGESPPHNFIQKAAFHTLDTCMLAWVNRELCWPCHIWWYSNFKSKASCSGDSE